MMSAPAARGTARGPRPWPAWLAGFVLLLTAPGLWALTAWPAWDAFAASYVQDDGRVVDWTTEARTVSEGQAYALFFALVAGDRARFERILDWTATHLARGDLAQHLPAWLWGRDEHERWRVLDENPASDADLWLSYTLLEAGRLWSRPLWTRLGLAMLDQIAAREVRSAGPHRVLMPAPQGFISDQGLRLNPSYWPPFQFAYFAAVQPDGPWQQLLDDYQYFLPDLSPGGRVPDWFVLTEYGPRLDLESGGQGGYDAIRVYLWAAFGPAELPAAQALRRELRPFADLVHAIGRPPERWYPDGRAPHGVAPPGYDAALAPFFDAVGAPGLAQAARQRVAQARVGDLLGVPARYYDQVLALFGEGFSEHRFGFGHDGRLELP